MLKKKKKKDLVQVLTRLSGTPARSAQYVTTHVHVTYRGAWYASVRSKVAPRSPSTTTALFHAMTTVTVNFPPGLEHEHDGPLVETSSGGVAPGWVEYKKVKLYTNAFVILDDAKVGRRCIERMWIAQTDIKMILWHRRFFLGTKSGALGRGCTFAPLSLVAGH